MRKILSILIWFGTMLLSLLGFVLAPITFPIYYLLRNTKLVHYKPLWYAGDEEDGIYGAQYWKDANGITKDTFWSAYRWSAIRNSMWNLQASLTPKEGPELFISAKGELTYNYEDTSLEEMAALHYENEDGSWAGNTGEILSRRFSTLGRSLYWFSKGGRLYWRYSFADKVYKNLWIELQLGTSTKRHLFKIKFKNIKRVI